MQNIYKNKQYVGGYILIIAMQGFRMQKKNTNQKKLFDKDGNYQELEHTKVLFQAE